MPALLTDFRVGEMVPTSVTFRCLPRHHDGVEEVRLASVTEVSDRRYKDGYRQVRAWAGYCSRCGRRVLVEPSAS